jgi:hypothetical protein
MIYGTPKKLPDGRYYLKVSPESDVMGRVMVQLNKVKLLTKFDESDDVTIELSESALAKIVGIDEQNVAASKVNSQAWFGKVLADQTLEAAYTKSFSKGVMNVTKPQYHKIYKNRELVGEESITEGTVCDVVIELCGISFTKKTFSPVWKIVQSRLKEPPKKKYHEEYLFQDDEQAEASDDDLFA